MLLAQHLRRGTVLALQRSCVADCVRGSFCSAQSSSLHYSSNLWDITVQAAQVHAHAVIKLPAVSMPVKTGTLSSLLGSQFHQSHRGIAISASAMAKFDAETLIKYAKQTEKALTEKSLSSVNFSPKVVLHQDAFTLNHDIEGEADVKKYLQAYFDKYEYEHDTLNYAVNPDTSCSFALSYDKVTSSVTLQHLHKQVVTVMSD